MHIPGFGLLWLHIWKNTKHKWNGFLSLSASHGVKRTKHGSSFKLDEDKSERLLTDEQWGDTENESFVCSSDMFPSGDDH